MIDRINQLSTRKKIALIILATVVATVSIALVQFVRVSGYRLLYADLSYQDSIAVTSWLSERNIGYRAKNNGADIYIEGDQVHRARLNIARGQQFTPGGILKITPDNPLSSLMPGSRLEESIRVENELTATITAFEAIDSARVAINTGHRPDGFGRTGKAHASVIIRSENNTPVSASDLSAIVTLVAQSVPGLSPASVTIYDSNGRFLSSGNTGQQNLDFSSPLLHQQQMLEQRLEQRAAEIVDTLIGPGRSLIKISVTLDNSHSEMTAEHSDPDNATIRKELTEYAPGSRYSTSDNSNQIQYIPPIPTTSSIDYEVDRTINKTIRPAGSIEHLAVSVLLSAKPETTPDGTILMVPPTEQELHSLKAALSAVTGIQPDRGDSITVIPVSQHTPSFERVSSAPSRSFFPELIIPAAKLIMLAIGFFLLYILLVKPILNYLIEEKNDGNDLTTSEDLDHQEIDVATKSKEDITIVLKKEILDDPAPAAHIIKNWLQET